MRYFSVFSGAGGFEIGIKNAYASMGDTHEHERPSVIAPDQSSTSGGSKCDVPLCVGFSEVDKYASAVLRYRFPETKNYGDITKIDWNDVPNFDLLVGGSPCQSFSIAGKRAGFNGKSGLFWEYVRCLQEKKPEHFIWENVKGVLSSNGGRDFGEILLSFSEAGYSLWWQVLNAKDFGVPQNRERIFVFGTRIGTTREVFFERESSERDSDSRIVAGIVTSRYPASQREGAYIEETRHSTGEGIKIKEATKLGYAVAHEGDSINLAVPESATRRGRVGKGIANTLDTGMQQHTLTGSRIRKLTPIECERLMSWEDDWTRWGDFGNGKTEISDSQRYKMCGNGVVSEVVKTLVIAHLI